MQLDDSNVLPPFISMTAINKMKTETWGAKEHDGKVVYDRKMVLWHTHIPWLMSMRQKAIDDGKEKLLQELDEAAEKKEKERKDRVRKPFRDQRAPVYSAEETKAKKKELHRRNQRQRQHNREQLSFGSVRASGMRWVRKQATSQSAGGAYIGAVGVPGS